MRELHLDRDSSMCGDEDNDNGDGEDYFQYDSHSGESSSDDLIMFGLIPNILSLHKFLPLFFFWFKLVVSCCVVKAEMK